MDLNAPVISEHLEGQNHDRIDAEMENSGPSTHENASNTATASAPHTNPSAEDVETMDITHDNTERQIDTNSGNLPLSSPTSASATSNDIVVGVGPNGEVTSTPYSEWLSQQNESLVRITSGGSTIDSNGDMDIVQPATTEVDPASAGILGSTVTGELPPQAVPQPPPADNPPIAEGEREENLMDDEEDPWWTDLVEDNSGPDEDELKAIEQAGLETSALDCKGEFHCHFVNRLTACADNHWEKTFWEDLDDPEHVPAEAGRIDWTVQGVRGTRAKPNRKTVLESPQKFIGGFYWTIRVYPRGDDTSQLSVYVACSPTPWEDEDEDEEISDAQDHEAVRDVPDNEPESVVVIVEDAPTFPDSLQEEPPMQDSASLPKAENRGSWAVAAQFGVVVYNPAEPRVQCSFKEQHQFCSVNADFGRRRLHGPWDEIHLRRRGQRQALLRNDTLAFSAYIRLVDDPTRSLWWNRPERGLPWDSFAKTGLRSLSTKMDGESFFTAGMAAWIHLVPFRELVSNMHIPDPEREPYARPKPLFAALQRIIYLTLHQMPTAMSVELYPIVHALKWYGIDLTTKFDTLLAWEVMWRKLEQEAEGTDTQGKLAELFGRVCLPDGKFPSVRLETRKVGSIQAALNSALNDRESVAGPIIRAAPELLQVELERQEFDTTRRTWKKITNRVELDEQLEFPSQGSTTGSASIRYSLYAMIVHRGALQSGLYYLVVRPGGPKTKWFRFYGDREGNQVQLLTRKQAIRAHEGFQEGERDEETAAVAYLVMYVRDDVFQGQQGGSGIFSQPLGKYLDSKVRGKHRLRGHPLTYAATIEDNVQNASDGDSTTTDNDVAGTVQAKPEAKISFRVFHDTVFNAHHGQGFIDVYNSQWSNEHSDNVYHITLDAKASLADVQRELLSLVGKGERSEQYKLWAMETGLDSVQGAPKLVAISTDTTLAFVGRNYPLKCLWAVVLPLCKLMRNKSHLPC